MRDNNKGNMMTKYEEWEIVDMYDDMLDECYGQVEIGGYAYNTSLALRYVDIIAYNEGLSEFEDDLEDDEGEEE